jgi:hypothetical protein
MDAAGLASSIAPTWFESVPDLVGPDHAGAGTWTAQDAIQQTPHGTASQPGSSGLYDWIVQFDTASLAGITSAFETTSLLVGGGIDFSVIRGLGMAGEVLVRSSGASFDAVESWLQSDVHVTRFEEDAVRQFDKTSNDPQLGNLWGMTKIHAQDAWNTSTGSRSVVVAVIDTGIDYTHADLAANIWTNPRETAGNGRDDDGDGFVDDVHGYNFVANTGDPRDDNGHGTHVSGTIAAVGNNGLGVAGVNWSTSLMALKFLNNQGQGYLSDAVRAINYTTMERTRYGVNVRVINASWGGGSFSSAMQNAIQAASDAGILFVTAAGNSATNNDASPQYPANYAPPNVISVAASDQNDKLASFSCYGATTVDIAAPGVSIYSTLPGNRYGAYSGTSMATPQVAGVAALAWSVAPNASMADVRNAILQGADRIATLSGKVVTGGRLNAYNTLQRLKAQPAPQVTPQPAPQPVPQPAPRPAPQPVTPAPSTTPSRLHDFSTIGLYSPNTSVFNLRNTNNCGNADASFAYAPAQGNWVSLAGDWDGDGKDTVGLYDAATSRFYLRNTNNGGNANVAFAYGPANSDWVPVVGDWDGDGKDTIGLYDPSKSVFYLRNTNDSGFSNVAFVYGPANSGWKPVAGDWNGDGKDTIGLYDPSKSAFYLRNTNDSGNANVAFAYGPANSGWKPIVGDWNADGKDTVGVYDASRSAFYLRNTNDSGNANVAFTFGPANSGWTPLVGDWNGPASSAKAANSGIFADPRAAVPNGAVFATPFQQAVTRGTVDCHAAAADWLADSTPASLEGNRFTGLAAHDRLSAGRGELLAALDSRFGDVLADAGLPRIGAALGDAVRSDADDLLPVAGDQLAADDLLLSCDVERHAIDGVFQRLGDPR